MSKNGHFLNPDNIFFLKMIQIFTLNAISKIFKVIVEVCREENRIEQN